jgi:hypothetical protein
MKFFCLYGFLTVPQHYQAIRAVLGKQCSCGKKQEWNSYTNYSNNRLHRNKEGKKLHTNYYSRLLYSIQEVKS